MVKSGYDQETVFLHLQPHHCTKPLASHSSAGTAPMRKNNPGALLMKQQEAVYFDLESVPTRGD